MRISYRISVNSGKRGRTWKNGIKDEGNDALPTESLFLMMVRELKMFLEEIEEAYPEIKDRNTSLDEHF